MVYMYPLGKLAVIKVALSTYRVIMQRMAMDSVFTHLFLLYHNATSCTLEVV